MFLLARSKQGHGRVVCDPGTVGPPFRVLYGNDRVFHVKLRGGCKRARIKGESGFHVKHAEVPPAPATAEAIFGDAVDGAYRYAQMLAGAGVVFKLFFTGRFKGISTLIYLGMGWMVRPAVTSIASGQLSASSALRKASRSSGA